MSPFSKTAEKLLMPHSWPLTGDRVVGLIYLCPIGALFPDDGAAKINPDLAADKGQRAPDIDPAYPSSLLNPM